MSVKFGFLVEPSGIAWSCGSIQKLPEHAEIVKDVSDDPRAYCGWFYPPLRGARRTTLSEQKMPPEMPGCFSLPVTHVMNLDSDDCDESYGFFIALFGMLKGTRLQRDGWQHFYKCPIKCGELCDFNASDREIGQALDIASKFWAANPSQETRKLAYGAIHWHLFAQLYEHEFERFGAQYSALDVCWVLANMVCSGAIKDGGHAKRCAALCTYFGLETPGWAIKLPAPEKGCPLSIQRNALIHEAMYADQPVGFSHPANFGGMALELTGLVARILFRILGIYNEYTQSPVTTRQTFGFAF